MNWTERTPDPTAVEPIYDLEFYDANTGIAINGKFLFKTTDGGFSWQRISFPGLSAGLSAHFLGSADRIVCEADINTVFLSIDGGITWSDITPSGTELITHIQTRSSREIDVLSVSKDGTSSGTLFQSRDAGASWNRTLPDKIDRDCFSIGIDSCDTDVIAIINEESIVAGIDPRAGVLVSLDKGISWSFTTAVLDRNYFCGSISIANDGAFFVQTSRDGILRSTDYGKHWISIGGPNGPTPDCRFVAAITKDTIYACDSSGAVWMTVNSGGTPIAPVSLRMPSKITATALGEEIDIPIYILGLKRSADLEFDLSFDSKLEYLGSIVKSGRQVDVLSSITPTSSHLIIPAADQLGDTLAAIARFRVFVDSTSNSTITCSNVLYSAFQEVCFTDSLQAATGAATTVEGPSGCGIDMLSDFLRYRKSPHFSIYPNPASSGVSLLCESSLGEATINISDLSGHTVFQEKATITAYRHLLLDISGFPRGRYTISILHKNDHSSVGLIVQ